MNYKEKYNKLVEAVKVLQETNPSDEGIQNWVKDNVPELRESEDEQIIKWIIDEIRYNMNNEPLYNSEYKKKAERAIAWLEKQGSPVLSNSSNVGKNEQKSADGVEQKPAWSEEDDQSYEDVVWCINKALQACHDENEAGTCWFAQRFINSVKQRLGGEK